MIPGFNARFFSTKFGDPGSPGEHPRQKGMSRRAGFCFNKSMQKTILSFVDDLYEDLELWYPKIRLEEAGFGMHLAAAELKTFRGKHGYPATADSLISEARSHDFLGLIIAGGFMPDKLRRDPKVLSLTRDFFEQGKLVAFVCHGGWIPISAKILKGKRATGSRGIKDDLENAGAIWTDEPVVIDGNLISSRTPKDLAPFARAIVDFLKASQPARHVPADKARPRKLPELKPAMVKGMLR